MYYDRRNKNLLILNEKEIEKAVLEYLGREHPKIFNRIRHMSVHMLFDEHSGFDPAEMYVYLEESSNEE